MVSAGAHARAREGGLLRADGTAFLRDWITAFGSDGEMEKGLGLKFLQKYRS